MADQYTELISFLNRMEDMGVFPMSDEEYDHCLFIGSLLDEDTSVVEGDGRLSFEEFQNRALDLLTIYNYSSLVERVKSIPLKMRDDASLLSFNTTISSEQGKCYSVTKIDCTKHPSRLSPYYLAHEFHHALKDTSKKEYAYMLRYADVLPQFFELIAGRDEKEQKNLIQNRLALLKDSKKMLIQRKHSNQFFHMIDSKNCQYLNSFYYSILLYSLFQDHPKLVLEQVRRVLSSEITTYELLDFFSLFQKDYDLEVEKTIQYLKKYSS